MRKNGIVTGATKKEFINDLYLSILAQGFDDRQKRQVNELVRQGKLSKFEFIQKFICVGQKRRIRMSICPRCGHWNNVSAPFDDSELEPDIMEEIKKYFPKKDPKPFAATTQKAKSAIKPNVHKKWRIF